MCLVVILLTACGLDWIISHGLLKMDDYRFMSWRELQDEQIDADIVINGCCHAKFDYNVSLLDSATNLKCYNLGIREYPFPIQESRLDYYLTKNQMPRILVQDVDAFSFRTMDVIDQKECEQFFPLFYNKYYRKYLKQFGWSFFDLYVPLYRYWGYHDLIKMGIYEGLGIKHYTNKPSYRGYQAEEWEWDERFRHLDQDVFACHDKSVMCQFDSYLQKCIDHGIDVILVYSPMHPYIDQRIIDHGIMKDFVIQESKKYEIPFYDYTDSMNICCDTTLFFDVGHMNRRGADVFSKSFSIVLMDEIKETY